MSAGLRISGSPGVDRKPDQAYYCDQVMLEKDNLFPISYPAHLSEHCKK